MHRRIRIALSCMAIGTLLITACGSDASEETAGAPTEPDAPDEAEEVDEPDATDEGEGEEPEPDEPDEPDEVFTLRFASDSPPPESNPYTEGTNEWMEHVEELSGGRIEFERFYAEGLVPSAEQLGAVSSGVADVTPLIPTFWEAQLPLSTIGWQPGLVADTWAAQMAVWDLIQEYPAFTEELEEKNNIKAVTGSAIGPFGLLSRERVDRLEDLSGMRVVTLGGGQSDWIEALGGVPVFIPSPDRYDSLARGTLDGLVGQPVSIGVFGFYEVAKYYYDIQLGGGAHYIAMNLDTWNSLPPDLQDVFHEAEMFGIEQAALKFQYEGYDRMIEEHLDPAGVEFIDATADDLAEAKRVAREAVWTRWIDEMEANGLPGQEIFDEFVERYQQYETESPFEGRFTPSEID